MFFSSKDDRSGEQCRLFDVGDLALFVLVILSGLSGISFGEIRCTFPRRLVYSELAWLEPELKDSLSSESPNFCSVEVTPIGEGSSLECRGIRFCAFSCSYSRGGVFALNGERLC